MGWLSETFSGDTGKIAGGTAVGLLLGAGGGAGAVAGGEGSVSKQAQSSEGKRSIELGQATHLEDRGRAASELGLAGISAGVTAGRGAAELAGAAQHSQINLAQRLEGFSGESVLPNQAQIGAARGFASDIFSPEQVALNQQFEDEETRVRRLSAQLGRPIDDPILQAKLAQEKIRQQASLSARQTAFTAQKAQGIADQQSNREIQSLTAATQIRQGLAQQALQNRATLLQLGAGALGAERQFRLASGTETTSRVGNINEYGQAPGNIAGALGGWGKELGIAGGVMGSIFGGMFGGGAGGGAGAASGGFGSYGGGNVAGNF